MNISRSRPRTGQLFARARPREIQIYEDYYYEADLSSHPLLLPSPKSPGGGSPAAESLEPQGKIVVITPYDGQKFFTAQAAADVTSAVVKKAIGEDTLVARVGHLALAGFDRTNLDEVAQLATYHNLLPLDLPVYGSGLGGVDDLAGDRHVSHLKLAYRPHMPEVVPLRVSVQISDEDSLRRAERAALAQTDPGDEWIAARRNLARQVDCPDPFLPALTLRFVVELILPPYLEPTFPEVKSVSLTWPVATSYENFRLSLSEQPGVTRSHSFHYRRHAASVEWGGIELVPTDAEQGAQPACYRAPEMSLHIANPDELIGHERLEGEMMVEIPVALSGGAVRYFSALGEEEAVKVKTRSQLKLAFSLDLLDCFQGRVYSPFHYLQFPGVPLNEERLSAIKFLLQRQGFTLEREWQMSPGEAEGAALHLLAFSRPEGAAPLRLWVRIEERAIPTLHPLMGPDGDGFSFWRENGETVIFLRAELAGDNRRPVAVLNAIHRLLKKRFPRWKMTE